MTVLKRLNDNYPGCAHVRGLRVLVVDDEMMVAMLLEDMLTELGCAVVGPVPNVADALDRLAAEKVDAALLDVNLSFGQSGYPVADDMIRRGVPFAFVTGYGAASLHQDYSDAPTLQKPFNLTGFMNVLTLLASRAELPRDVRRA